ncbi:ATP12-domain-containing protein [Fomitiporia mediterranea MF3/22]|uniref:ATP12-domain-containing protein n=1 Tax=Fomitiporia mediterranea (strain MF3/22) TaxID=694068 RepID=UPI0004407FBC|nr:ATP12-domain-containing protein [Fomitiporia mediterranea MF3/22]EJD05961.1 ATP12-domain-containing protein [Fomitiporia mediterranea MF3/22]
MSIFYRTFSGLQQTQRPFSSLYLASRQVQRSLATTADGTPVTATNRAEATLKRFWKTVGIDTRSDGIAVTLDRRALKTPSGNILILPHEKRLAAALIANEWENQDKVLKPHALPMATSRAIDAFRERQTREEVTAALLKYLETDTICFHEDSPEALVRLQDAHWQPLLSWIRDEYNVDVGVHKSVLGTDQPPETIARLGEILKAFDEWQLAAMERATYTTKSFIIALALIRGQLDVEQAAQAGHVEVNSQIEKWGEVEDSHDVDYQDIRRQLGTVACLVS